MIARVLAVAVVAWSAPSLAANTTVPTSKPVAALQQCRTVADPATRVACYDRAVDALTAATASNEVVIVERQEVRKVRKGLFGFSVPRIGFLTGRADNVEDKADAAELETTITASRSIGNGKWRFTVEGGATWETVETNMGFSEPLPGRKVLLEAGSLGSYFATVGKGRRVQAKRIG
ncbi:MAG: hypothetical protein ABI898_01525 [Sphingomonadales bacterium]